MIMAPRLGNKGEHEKKQVVGRLRRAQLVTTFGSGAIVDMPDYSVIIASIKYWNENSPKLYEPNLERLLKVTHFRQPYASQNSETEYTPDVPAFRFPIMHFCPKCGRLMPYWGFGNDGKICSNCQKNIIPSRFIAACINGHLEDFPYLWWVHYGSFDKCDATDKDDCLRISFSDKTGSLDGIVIKCTKCGKQRSMAGCMAREALKGYHCRGKRPWIGIRHEHNDPVDCKAPMRVLQRSASNVYFSLTDSALTIPPWSDRLHQAISPKREIFSKFLKSNMPESYIKTMINIFFEEVLSAGLYSSDDLYREIIKMSNSDDDEEYTRQKLYEEEYHVFCKGNYQQEDDYQFRIERTDVPDFLKEYIDDVVLVKRLREVLALRGFRRIFPEMPDSDDPNSQGLNMDSDYVPLSDTPLDWYPAIEMLGEGIFIRLNEDELSKWESANKNHYAQMGHRLSKSTLNCLQFSPRYVLLHTLSHLLIKQLSVECGYSGAALKERIYSTYPNSGMKMAGILLYTSSSDSDGSLGGLVRNGLSVTFGRIFENMLQESSWCSSDPVCIESKAQGFDSLNYAACHACTLLPETSCEMRNCLLDRGAVVGSLNDRLQGYFGKLLLRDNIKD